MKQKRIFLAFMGIVLCLCMGCSTKLGLAPDASQDIAPKTEMTEEEAAQKGATFIYSLDPTPPIDEIKLKWSAKNGSERAFNVNNRHYKLNWSCDDLLEVKGLGGDYLNAVLEGTDPIENIRQVISQYDAAFFDKNVSVSDGTLIPAEEPAAPPNGEDAPHPQEDSKDSRPLRLVFKQTVEPDNLFVAREVRILASPSGQVRELIFYPSYGYIHAVNDSYQELYKDKPILSKEKAVNIAINQLLSEPGLHPFEDRVQVKAVEFNLGSFVDDEGAQIGAPIWAIELYMEFPEALPEPVEVGQVAPQIPPEFDGLKDHYGVWYNIHAIDGNILSESFCG